MDINSIKFNLNKGDICFILAGSQIFTSYFAHFGQPIAEELFETACFQGKVVKEPNILRSPTGTPATNRWYIHVAALSKTDSPFHVYPNMIDEYFCKSDMKPDGWIPFSKTAMEKLYRAKQIQSPFTLNDSEITQSNTPSAIDDNDSEILPFTANPGISSSFDTQTSVLSDVSIATSVRPLPLFPPNEEQNIGELIKQWDLLIVRLRKKFGHANEIKVKPTDHEYNEVLEFTCSVVDPELKTKSKIWLDKFTAYLDKHPGNCLPFFKTIEQYKI